MSSKRNDNMILEHHSPVRHIINEANGIANDELIKSFAEAKDIPKSYVIMEGDWGGQIYLSCPMEMVKCREELLHALLDDLDRIAWECNEGEGKGLYYEIHIPATS